MSNNNNTNTNLLRKNSDIRARQVRLIDNDGNQLGIRNLDEAIREAQYAGLDLVEIAPQAKPPVCKIMDYSKYAYQKSKRDKLNKQKRKVTKTINFNYKVDDHDLEIKVNQARKFLEKGNDVRIEMRFRGRESMHTDRMTKKMKDICENIKDIGNYTEPSVEQRAVTVLLTPKSSK